jgi:hypothetical protein
MQLPYPGSDFGPCAAPCAHPYCARVRAAAAQLCFFCGQEIGYGHPFVRLEFGGNVVWAHESSPCPIQRPELHPRPNTIT